MLEFTDYIYIGLYVLVILVLKEIIEYVFITRKRGNVIYIEETVSNTKTNEIGTNTRFKKKKGGKDDKVVEGFAQCPDGSSSPLHPIDNFPVGILNANSINDGISNCERAQWLFCNKHFETLVNLIRLMEYENYMTTLDAYLYSNVESSR